MSKIGKKLIAVPKGVEVRFQNGEVSVKGAKGQLIKTVPPELKVSVEGDMVKVEPVVDISGKSGKEVAVKWGLYRALIQNMIVGVSQGFEKTLEFQGVGYKANVKGSDLELNLGFSHPILYKAPEGVAFKVDKGTIVISGIDREIVGQVAAEIRSKKEPEPYKGSGIKYAGEIIRRKAGKKAVASG